jgi:hypothetical protein
MMPVMRGVYQREGAQPYGTALPSFAGFTEYAKGSPIPLVQSRLEITNILGH